MTLYNYMYYIIPLALAIHFITTRFVWNTGTKYYNSENLNQDLSKPIPLYDIIHSNTPDYSMYNYSKNWYIVLFLLPLFINFDSVSGNFLTELVVKFCLILIIRSITMSSTILPPQSGCQVKHLGLFNMTIGGTCYDKMFSGHFAFGLLLTLMMFKYGIVGYSRRNILYFSLVNVLHAFILTVTRSHYTMDVTVALFITLFVNNLYDNYISL